MPYLIKIQILWKNEKNEGTETDYLAEYLITRNGDIRKRTGRVGLLMIYS